MMLMGQALPEHISNQGLYEFLDELANDGIIELASAAKPYPRNLIAKKLVEAKGKAERLTARQGQQLRMYLNDFGLELHEDVTTHLRLFRRDTSFLFSILPPTLISRDSFFRFNLRPILGAHYYTNHNGSILHSWGGAAVNSYVGSNWAVWASLRDNRMDGGRLSGPTMLTQELGGIYKSLTGGGVGGEFSEMRGGIAWSWRWGYLSLEKDHLAWGDGYNGTNILSGRTPSFAMLKLNMHPAKWLEFNYFHGWLMSMVVDSVRTYTPNPGDPERTIFRDKYIAANLFTLKPWPRLHISFGNSVIYSDMGVYPAYLIPFMFYKSIVHTQTAGVRGHNHNSAMFFNISSRQIRHLHLYATLFVDEFSVSRIGDPTRTNFTSTKAGMRLSNWPIRNVSLTAEYTFTYPKTFQHRTLSTTFESNRYQLGHYLRDNARELFLNLGIKPLAGLTFDVSYLMAQKGNVVPYIYNSPTPVDEDPFMQEVVWSNETLSLRARYTLYSNVSTFAEVRYMNIQGHSADGREPQHYLNLFTPSLFQGKTNTTVIGLQVGF